MANNHGGRRPNAGRPTIGLTRKVSITLPEHAWNDLYSIQGDPLKPEVPLSAVLRHIILSYLYGSTKEEKTTGRSK